MFRSLRLGREAAALLAVLMGSPRPAVAQGSLGPSPKRAAAVRLSGPIKVDGRLDEGTWQAAPAISDFTQKDPYQGERATERTEVRFAFDDRALYVGLHLYSSRPARIPRDVTRRDQYGNSESVVISLDPYLDRRTAYSFAITSGGVRRDYYHSRDSEDFPARDFTYDPVWEARVRFDSTGWTAEMRIPFSQLRFTKKTVQQWGLNINRWIPQKNEDDYWVLVPKDETGFASRFGTLEGIEEIAPSRRAELVPYVAANGTFAAQPVAGDPFSDGSNSSLRAGGDIKVGLGPSLTLDGTFNPDFGQVEADPAELNLTAFETIFPERRPFFTDGNPSLSGPVDNYYYSRRIGALPRGSASGDFVDMPQFTTILGAARITGRAGPNLSLGAQAAVTQREFARTYTSATGTFDKVEVEPLASYGVLRLQQQFGAASSTVGFSLSGMNRFFTGGSPLRQQFSDRAAAGGFDWRIRFQGGRYELTGHAGFSMVRGDSNAILAIQQSSGHYLQRPDFATMPLDPRRTSLWGFTGGLRMDKNAGKWLWGAEVTTESPGFETNDMGRLQNADDIDANADINYRETSPGRVFRRWNVGISGRQNWNYDKVRGDGTYALFANGQLWNYYEFQAAAGIHPRYLSDVMTRGGPLAGRELIAGISWSLMSSWAKPNGWQVNGQAGRGETDFRFFEINGAVNIRPASKWGFSIGPRYLRVTEPRQYLETLTGGTSATYGSRYVFATVDQSVLGAQFRLNYTFTPDLTLEAYAEPFTAGGAYTRHGELPAAGSYGLRVYGTDGTTIAREGDSYTVTDSRNGQTFTIPVSDFNNFSFRSNLVLRWEWRRGSTLYLVWQQNRSGTCAPSADPSTCPTDYPPGTLSKPAFLGSSLRIPGDNYLALKISYWLPAR